MSQWAEVRHLHVVEDVPKNGLFAGGGEILR